MKLYDLAEQENWCHLMMGVGRTIEDEYPRRYDELGGYASPMHTCHYGLRWLWLKWHASQSIADIRSILNHVIRRSIALSADKMVSQYLRDRHDHLLIQMSVLTGDITLMSLVSQSVIAAVEASREYQCYQAFAGMIKYRILGDEDEVCRQNAIFERHEMARTFVYPTRRMISSFVAKDYDVLHKVVRERAEHWWKSVERLKFPAVSYEGDEKSLNLRLLSPNFYWPWVHATLLKLAYMDGAKITYDSIWIPLDLIKAV